MRSRYMNKASKPTTTPHKAMSVVFSGKDNELTKDNHQVLILFHRLAIAFLFTEFLGLLTCHKIKKKPTKCCHKIGKCSFFFSQ